jgi:hypothetical protein
MPDDSEESAMYSASSASAESAVYENFEQSDFDVIDILPVCDDSERITRDDMLTSAESSAYTEFDIYDDFAEQDTFFALSESDEPVTFDASDSSVFDESNI